MDGEDRWFWSIAAGGNIPGATIPQMKICLMQKIERYN